MIFAANFLPFFKASQRASARGAQADGAWSARDALQKGPRENFQENKKVQNELRFLECLLEQETHHQTQIQRPRFL